MSTELTSGIYGNPNPIPAIYNGLRSPVDNTYSSIIPASGFYGTNWPSYSGSVIPQGLGGGGWTFDGSTSSYDRGYPQQTFLGASIRNFNMNGGFGDSSSTLSVDLVVDEYNKSDRTNQGFGDDVYHSGNGDRFVPPMAGSPVFFKFGPNFATVEEAYRRTFDSIYRTNTMTAYDKNRIGTFDKNNFKNLQNNQFVNLQDSGIYDFTNLVTQTGIRGSGHIVFGGILQSYIQNRGPGANPAYSVQVTDPREILSNTVVILNNYAGSTFGTKNIFNIYGFLEHNFTTALSGQLNQIFNKGFNILTKYVDSISGIVTYSGSKSSVDPVDCWIGTGPTLFPAFGSAQASFPFTGTGMSRRGSQGIPYYRVAQAINALMSVEYNLPDEYIKKGYGGVINFRGYNYVVDFSGLPTLPPMYYLDFDQINLLDLALEICEVASRDLFVTLLPVINHPACRFIYNKNNTQSQPVDTNKLIAGIIRLDSIDRSSAPAYGAIKKYIDNLAFKGIYVENQDVGYELSNVVTDKFVVGAQEVDMYCFSTNADRDFINVTKRRANIEDTDPDWKQWTLEKQLEQQVLPYYGTLGQNAVTIPKGWGSYQQILLDTTGLNAKGVGAYYVATEMELRCASISYECWKNFLQQYNDIYMESIEEDDTYQGAVLSQTPNFGGIRPRIISNGYVVTVPRSVFETYATTAFGSDGLPSSPCNPPYGYPLYYKRMTKIGIPEGGLTKLQSRITGMITGAAAIRGADGDTYEEIKNSQLSLLEQVNYEELSEQEKTFYTAIKNALNTTPPNIDLLNDAEENLHKIGAVLPRLAKKGTENALKVYEFLKKIADENLGKKFLVRIPSKVNLFYDDTITWKNNSQTAEYLTGPFGFKPRIVTSGIAEAFSTTFKDQVKRDRPSNENSIQSFLSSGIYDKQDKYVGGLRVNFNPVSDKHEFNYSPSNLGGYFPFDLYTNTLSYNEINALSDDKKPKAVFQQLIPQDATNFIDENGRLSAYVRFDHSEHLALGSMNSEDFSQQLITTHGMIPDLCEFLDNVGEDKWESFNDADANNRDNNVTSQQVTFVKCSVDEKFYMPPKIIAKSLDVYGGDYTTKTKVSRPRKIFIACSGWRAGSTSRTQSDLVPGTGCYIDSYNYIEYNLLPTGGDKTGSTVNTRLTFDKFYSSEINSNLIKTDIKNLDTRFVYALITLPNKIIPTKDSRYRDAFNQKINTQTIKHYLTTDVIKGLPEFNVPQYALEASLSQEGYDSKIIGFPSEIRSRAWLAARKAKKSLQFGFAQQIQTSAPSPVYPDLVVLPLISNERCYGPWISSQVDPQSNAYINVGGRVEFIKDENLAPWNYAGYDLLNSAGVLQAQFSNSLLLFSERGGFVFPGIPDRSLCQALEAGGPLVTNISVDVSEAGLKTTYKLDLYTASFGKLQKQKQDMISKISRERQKLRDERNALIRKGIGKSQSSINTIGAINLFGNNGTIPIVPQMPNYIVASVNEYETQSYVPAFATFGDVQDGGNSDPASVSSSQYNIAVGFTTENQIIDDLNTIGGSTKGDTLYHDKVSKTGATPIDKLYMPYSEEYNSAMPNYINNSDPETRQQLYNIEE